MDAHFSMRVCACMCECVVFGGSETAIPTLMNQNKQLYKTVYNFYVFVSCFCFEHASHGERFNVDLSLKYVDLFFIFY